MVLAETVLWLLENGNSHHLKDVEEKTHWNSVKGENLTKSLVNYYFVKLDEAGLKVKPGMLMKEFLKRIGQLENEENLCN